jgi:two-component system sensor histidine kinase YesM
MSRQSFSINNTSITKYSSFKGKLIIAFLLCSSIPLFLLAGVAYNTTLSIAQDKTVNSVILTNNLIQQSIDYRFSQIETLSDNVQFQIHRIYLQPEDPLSSYIDTFSDVRNSLSSFKDAFSFYQICVFFPSSSFISNEGLMFQNLDSLRDYHISYDYLTNIGTSSKWLYVSDMKVPHMLSPKENNIDTILNIRALPNKHTTSIDYVYFIAIKSEELSQLLTSSFANTTIESFIIDDNRNIIASSNADSVNHKVQNQLYSLLLDNTDKTYFNYNDSQYIASSLNNDWHLMTRIPNSYIKKNVATVANIIIIAFFIMLPITIAIIIIISGNLTKRLKKLTHIVEATKINHTQIIKPPLESFINQRNTIDEIDKLTYAYYNMVDTIDNSFNNILKLSLEEEKLEYQLLQSKINPHFLYNILNSIYSCMSIGQLEIAKKLILDLSNFYKLSLKNSKQLISIEDELHIAKLYLNMEKLCKNNRFDWKIVLSPGVEHFLIPKFTLQPFLENCIIHGLEGINHQLQIYISVIINDDKIQLIIQDNGIGISPDTLKSILHSLQNNNKETGKHYGIRNVNMRISSPHYGNGFISISSVPNNKTTVTITFDQIIDEKDDTKDEY